MAVALLATFVAIGTYFAYDGGPANHRVITRDDPVITRQLGPGTLRIDCVEDRWIDSNIPPSQAGDPVISDRLDELCDNHTSRDDGPRAASAVIAAAVVVTGFREHLRAGRNPADD